MSRWPDTLCIIALLVTAVSQHRIIKSLSRDMDVLFERNRKLQQQISATPIDAFVYKRSGEGLVQQQLLGQQTSAVTSDQPSRQLGGASGRGPANPSTVTGPQ